MNSEIYNFEAAIQKVPDIDGAYVAVPFDIKKSLAKAASPSTPSRIHNEGHKLRCDQ